MHCFNVSLSLISQTFFSTKMHSIEDAKLQNVSLLIYKEGKLMSTGKHLFRSTEKYFYSRVKQKYICTWMPEISESMPTFILTILPIYVTPLPFSPVQFQYNCYFTKDTNRSSHSDTKKLDHFTMCNIIV